MNLDAARKRHGKGKRRVIGASTSNEANAEINVTPLVDVVLVLLIIFMVMTPVAEKVLSIKLTSQSSAATAHAAAPEQLIVTLETQAVRINAEQVPPAALEAQLRTRLSQRSDSERVVFVVAENGVSYAALVESIAAAKRAGAVTVGVVP